MRFGFFTAIAFSLLLPFTASALGIGATEDGMFTVSVSPQYPEPQSQVTLSALSSSIDLSNAILTVSAAGKEIYKGSVRPVAVSVGRTGSVTNIKITITSAGASYNKTVSVQPQDVSLIPEPVASTHVLYQGKPLIPIEGNVRMVAVANMQSVNGKIIDPMALSYSWTIDDVRIANASGIGKETIIVTSPLEYRSRSVYVVVTSQDGSLVGGASFSFTAQKPSVRIYENDPLLGILFDKEISNSYEINNAESTLFATPFSFSTTSGEPILKWFLNGVAAQTGASITLRPTGSGQGSASLSLVASSDDSEKVTKNLSLLFGATAGGIGLFGL
jgi:hypothetical protein